VAAARPTRPDTARSTGGRHLVAHTSSVATCASSTVANRPTVVMGDSPGGSVEAEVRDTTVAPSAVMVPRIYGGVVAVLTALGYAAPNAARSSCRWERLHMGTCVLLLQPNQYNAVRTRNP
jgi:hypothetical protein